MSDTLWKSCVEWLIKAKVLPPNHEAIAPGADVKSLAQSLRDGVLICHLLNVLENGAIDPREYNQRPQMSQFLCLKNIRVFLQTCKSVFGLRESDLFDSYDLYDMRNFEKVVTALSKLSKTPSAQRTIPGGFPDRNIKSDPDIYSSLPSLEPQDLNNDEDPYGVLPFDEEQDIYEDLCACRMQLQQKSTEPKSKRDYCVKELVETEKNYVDALNMVITHFMRPLKVIIPAPDRDKIFRYVEELAQIHTGFHSELQQAVVSTTKPYISDVFLKWKHKLLIYGDFCSHLPDAQLQIDEVCKDDKCNTAIVECQKKANDGRFRLRDLLSVPMQRVLKYHLLLKELQKCTEQSHLDYEGLSNALEAMHDLSAFVNEVKRDNESLKLIQDIQNSIIDLAWPENTSLKDYGRLQKDGELRVRSHDDTRPRTRYVFLFDRVLLMCKSKGDVYSYKNCLILANFRIDIAGSSLKEKGEKWCSPFLLVEKNNTNAITFYAKNDEMRQKWTEQIQVALDNNQPAGFRTTAHDFVMYTFPKPTECSVCQKLLRGVFFQGYFCKVTAMTVHKECIKNTEDTTHDPPTVPPRPTKPESSGSFRAIKGYKGFPAPHNGCPALFFDERDVIEVTERNDVFWKGSCNGREGWFPQNLVQGLSGTPLVSPSRISLRRNSSGSSSISDVPGTPPPRSSYINLDLDQCPWFVGVMGREDAAKALESLQNGTFLVRESINPKRKGDYSLSIKYTTGVNTSLVKHIKINKTETNEYCVSDLRFFKSIPELISHYQQNSLKECFLDLNTLLKFPIKDAPAWNDATATLSRQNSVVGYAIASYEFIATRQSHLPLSPGDKVTILNKDGANRGWWKGQLNGRIGYFPCQYVKELM